jgi:hypothetical protein
MAREPESLGARLRGLEAEMARLRSDIAQRDAELAVVIGLLDEFVIPMLLRTAGEPLRSEMQHHLAGALRLVSDRLHHPDTFREDALEHVRGWMRAVDAVPDWSALDYDARHPEETASAN